MSFDNQWYTLETLTTCHKRKTKNISALYESVRLWKKNEIKNSLSVPLIVYVAD